MRTGNSLPKNWINFFSGPMVDLWPVSCNPTHMGVLAQELNIVIIFLTHLYLKAVKQKTSSLYKKVTKMQCLSCQRTQSLFQWKSLYFSLQFFLHPCTDRLYIEIKLWRVFKLIAIANNKIVKNLFSYQHWKSCFVFFIFSQGCDSM